jgi:hypothetical protein
MFEGGELYDLAEGPSNPHRLWAKVTEPLEDADWSQGWAWLEDEPGDRW